MAEHPQVAMVQSSSIAASDKSIWDQMVFQEKKLAASRKGLRISDYEESMALENVITESMTPSNEIDTSIEGEFITNNKQSICNVKNELEKPWIDDNDNDNGDGIENITLGTSSINTSNSTLHAAENDEIVEISLWLTLPREIGLRILLMLSDVDMCGYLQIVSKQHPFLPNEMIYKTLCENIFLRQTTRRKLVVENWKSWRNMLIYRPRLRTNGLYTLRTVYTKAPCNDNFWEEKRFEFIEVKYFRHMRFFDHGKMLYSMDIKSPYEMFKHFEHFQIVHKRIYEGRYFLSGKELLVEVVLHYCIVQFKMIVMDGDDGYIGKHNMLKLIEHSSVPLSSHMCTQFNQLNQTIVNGNPTMATNYAISEIIGSYYDSNPLSAQVSLADRSFLLIQQQLQMQRVYYPLPEVADLRYYRQWDWQPGLPTTNVKTDTRNASNE